jgi:hypothetical protein
MATESEVLAEFRRHADKLIPGAPEALARQMKFLQQLGATALAGKVAGVVDGPLGELHRNPAYEPCKVTPFRDALERRADLLRDGALEELEVAWGPDFSYYAPDRVAEELARRLAQRDNQQYLRSPDIPTHELSLQHVLHAHFRGEMPTDAIERFARERSTRLMGKPEAEVVRYVADCLKSPVIAGSYGAKTVHPSDDRHRAGWPDGYAVAEPTPNLSALDAPAQPMRSTF